jgi:hypothetical protein
MADAIAAVNCILMVGWSEEVERDEMIGSEEVRLLVAALCSTVAVLMMVAKGLVVHDRRVVYITSLAAPTSSFLNRVDSKMFEINTTLEATDVVGRY